MDYAHGFTDGVHYSLACIFMLACIAFVLIILNETVRHLR